MAVVRSVTCIVGIVGVLAVCFVGDTSAGVDCEEKIKIFKVNETSIPRKLLALPGTSDYDGSDGIGVPDGPGGQEGVDGPGGPDGGTGGSDGPGDGSDEGPINRIGPECSKRNIDVFQGPTAPLPSGIPTYTVEVQNICVTGKCTIANIHLSCGWFSSARLINPNIFRRLSFNDCLVNNGQPVAPGQTLTFQYANTFPYPLSVSSVTCL